MTADSASEDGKRVHVTVADLARALRSADAATAVLSGIGPARLQKLTGRIVATAATAALGRELAIDLDNGHLLVCRVESP